MSTYRFSWFDQVLLTFIKTILSTLLLVQEHVVFVDTFSLGNLDILATLGLILIPSCSSGITVLVISLDFTTSLNILRHDFDVIELLG